MEAIAECWLFRTIIILRGKPDSSQAGKTFSRISTLTHWAGFSFKVSWTANEIIA